MTDYVEYYCSELEDEIGSDVSKTEFYLHFLRTDTLGKMKKALNPLQGNYLVVTETTFEQVKNAFKAFFWALVYAATIILRIPFGWLFVLYLDLGRIGKAWKAYNKYLEDKE